MRVLITIVSTGIVVGLLLWGLTAMGDWLGWSLTYWPSMEVGLGVGLVGLVVFVSVFTVLPD